MEQRKLRGSEPAQAIQTEQLLVTRYNQLLHWGAILTRGDAGKAEDIVQELCLYFTLTKPDLREVSNLDGYLYTCLRHIYLSSLSRSSREALRFVSIADFDSFDFAIAAHQSGDPLQTQNDLRRICNYAVWRKEQSKSASYFILHFFHGYSRREIADLACLPISAIYNKLKSARSEVKSHLDETGKLRIIAVDPTPTPHFSWSLLSAEELFKELRKTILHARTSECLPEDTLLAHYRSSRPTPLGCSLLSHIVSCERCLRIIDDHFRRPTLREREALDSVGSSSEGSINNHEPGVKSQRAMLQSVRKRWERVHEHRPSTLSIAVNGKIIAFHDVQSQRSSLSARVDTAERERFVEVFSEQDVRLALLSVGEPPPDGPRELKQYVSLSDSRWLELSLTFDGLGLNSEVIYFDPALATDAVEVEAEDFAPELTPISRDSTDFSYSPLRPTTSWISLAFNRLLRPLIPSSALTWALALTILVSSIGYLAYRHARLPMDAEEILKRSVKMETASLQGQTEHQVMSVEEVSEDGRILQKGAIDLWKDGNGSRYMRRFYDSQHRLLAAEWRNKSGEHRSRLKEQDRGRSHVHRALSMSGLWDQDLSASAFTEFGGLNPHLAAVDGGYELTTIGPVKDHPQVISATLVLDDHLLPTRQILRVRAGSEIHEIRFVQTGFERKPSSAVPDTIFDPGYIDPHSAQDLHPHSGPDDLSAGTVSDVKLAQLQISVLYQLNSLQADIGEPIEVTRTPEGRLRVSGAIAEDVLKREIVSHLEALEDHQLLDLRLTSGRDLREQASSLGRPGTPEDTSVYDIGLSKPIIEATLRKHFETKGISGNALNASVGQYSRDALQHAQRALQNAYALHRLGSALSATEFSSIGLTSQEQWTEMVHKHAADLEGQLRALHGQLVEIVPFSERSSNPTEHLVEIESSSQFNNAAMELLHQTQDLNSDIGQLFTANPTAAGQSDPDSLLSTIMKAIPLWQAEQVTRFASKLKNSERSALADPAKRDDGEGTLKQPQ
ncbi:sigma-70 family RNA polymerase sigma factor [Tunturiibacter lichenicola]|uniref:sigma-70 family RNA polymerase sigma factor n=1 Tax=Tunturiibacter lichenicola TaxID=2051959 RepID=UPI003D9BCC7D